MPFARFAPDQPRRAFHRFQHVYMWALYGLFAIKWHTVGDFGYLRDGRIGDVPVRWPRGRELAGFWLFKAAFLAWAIVVPLLLHPAWQVAFAFLATSFVLALTLAVTFQLAHCLEEADFSSVEGMAAAGPTEWARHQIETTVDFAPRSRLLTWYLGGLNFQVEHHLFSRVCHTHYPAMAEVVREVCARHGIRHRSHPRLGSALASHARWLREMGTDPAGAPPASGRAASSRSRASVSEEERCPTAITAAAAGIARAADGRAPRPAHRDDRGARRLLDARPLPGVRGGPRRQRSGHLGDRRRRLGAPVRVRLPRRPGSRSSSTRSARAPASRPTPGGGPVAEPDLGGDARARWPGFRAGALAAGAAAVFAFPLRVGAVRLGSLTVYQDAPGPLTDDQHRDALAMAEVAVHALLRWPRPVTRPGERPTGSPRSAPTGPRCTRPRG